MIALLLRQKSYIIRRRHVLPGKGLAARVQAALIAALLHSIYLFGCRLVSGTSILSVFLPARNRGRISPRRDEGSAVPDLQRKGEQPAP